MPLYDYTCSVCGHQFERIVTAYDTEKKEPCPKCESPSNWTLPTGSRDRVKFLFNYMAPEL